MYVYSPRILNVIISGEVTIQTGPSAIPVFLRSLDFDRKDPNDDELREEIPVVSCVCNLGRRQPFKNHVCPNPTEWQYRLLLDLDRSFF